MKQFWVLVAIIMLLVVHAAVCEGQAIPDGHYFGQDRPGLVPEIFAPGVISLDDRFEYSLVFSPNLDECIFGVTNSSWSVFNEWFTRMDGDSTWIDPIPAPFQGTGDGLLASYTADGNEIYFASSRPGYPPANIWRSIRDGDGWSEPVALDPPINSDADEWGPTLTDDGTLYFCSFRAGGYGEGDLYRTVTTRGREITVETLGPTINSAQNDASPHIARDGSYILFESERPGGFGQADLYISFNENGVWTVPRNLGPHINTNQIEDGPAISPDGEYLFFNRREAWYTTQQTDIWWIDARAAIDSMTAGAGDPRGWLREGSLLHNAPNPFNIETTITYFVPSPGLVQIRIHDIVGREVQSLINTWQSIGTYSIDFDASHMERAAAGIYYCTLQVGEEEMETRKMVLLR